MTCVQTCMYISNGWLWKLKIIKAKLKVTSTVMFKPELPWHWGSTMQIWPFCSSFTKKIICNFCTILSAALEDTWVNDASTGTLLALPLIYRQRSNSPFTHKRTVTVLVFLGPSYSPLCAIQKRRAISRTEKWWQESWFFGMSLRSDTVLFT